MLVLPQTNFGDDKEARRMTERVYRVPTISSSSLEPTKGAIAVIQSGHFRGNEEREAPPYYLVADPTEWTGGVRGNHEMWWIGRERIIGGHLAFVKKCSFTRRTSILKGLSI